jgi:predicted DNA-binding transcriptional regulator YafY
MDRNEILCGIEGEIVEIEYGDAKTGITKRVVTIASIYELRRWLFMDGFCHLRLDDRTFRLDRIHFIRELTQSGAYSSVIDWLASYGVEVYVGTLSGRPTYRFRPPRP